MAALTKAGIRTEVRGRVGDDDSSNYFMSDTAMDAAIDAVYTELSKYARKDYEDTSLTGDGTSIELSLPAGVIPNLLKKVKLRTNSDPSTDLTVINYSVFNGKIRLPFVASTTTKVVLQYSLPYTLSDSVDSTVAEIIYELMEINWIDYAAKKRSDFEQWATIRRSDASIGDLLQLRRTLKMKLEELAQEVTTNLTVSDVWGGV